MANNVNAQRGTFKGYGLVRNAQGQPQFSDWENIPEVYHPLLTEEDWEYIRQMRDKRN